MRGVAAYLTAGILAVLAVDMIAPAGVVGLPVKAWPAVGTDSIVQSVDRTNKGDRLRAPAAAGKQRTPVKTPTALVGCDPLVSPLSASARAEMPGRCLT